MGKSLTILLLSGAMMSMEANVAVTLGETALDMGHEVNLFLFGEAVTAAIKDQAPKRFPSLSEDLTRMAGKGLKIAVCSTCSQGERRPPDHAGEVMRMVKTMLTIIKSAPYGREDAFAGLRFSLSQIAAGMVDTCDTLLIEDGIYNAKLNQDTKAIRMPSNLEAVQDLLDLDGKVLVVIEDMESRFVMPDDLPEKVDIYDAFATF